MTPSVLRRLVYVFCGANILGLLGYIAAIYFSSIEVNHQIMLMLGLGALVPITVFKMFELSVGGYEDKK